MSGGLWVSIWLTTAELPPDAGPVDLMPKSGMLYASKQACEAANAKYSAWPAGKSIYRYPDGHSVEIKSKTHRLCLPVYMDPEEFDKAFGKMTPPLER